ncbi:MAG: hypothetical protein AAFO69_18940, partial [Bacteroidota bacterium]
DSSFQLRRDTSLVKENLMNTMVPQEKKVLALSDGAGLRRNLQRELHRIPSLDMAEEKFRTQYANCRYDVRKFQEDTNRGANLDALHDWDKKITQALEDHPLEVIPEILNRNFGYGINIGMGSGIFTKTISDFFTPTFNFIFGFDIAYKNTVLFVNGTLAANRVRSAYFQDGRMWPKDLKTNVAVIDLSVGKALLDNAKHKITPFIGFGILEFSAAIGEGEAFENHRMVDTGLIYGLNYDFKIKKVIRLTPSLFGNNSGEKIAQNIRLRLYVIPAEFDNMTGTSINLTVGYGVFGRKVRIR